MSKWLLAVDGGGTSTEYCIADLEGNVQFSVFTGSTSIKSVGNPMALANIQDGLRQLQARGAEIEDIACGIWGMSGCDTPDDKMVYEALLGTSGLPEGKHHVVNDAILAYWAAADIPGLVVVCGTGSIVTGIDSNGKAYRIGGWNYIYSDLASGYWMGRRLMRETSLWLDGCREDDPVFHRTWLALAPRARSSEDAQYALAETKDPVRIAALGQLVVCSGDSPIANRIRTEAVEHLMNYVTTMYRKLENMGEKDLKIVLSGGLFKSDIFRRQMTEALTARYGDSVPVIWGERSPALGGIRVARVYFGR